MLRGRNDKVTGRNDQAIGRNDKVIGWNGKVIGRNDKVIGRNDTVRGRNDKVIGRNDKSRTNRAMISRDLASARFRARSGKTEGQGPDAPLRGVAPAAHIINPEQGRPAEDHGRRSPNSRITGVIPEFQEHDPRILGSHA